MHGNDVISTSKVVKLAYENMIGALPFRKSIKSLLEKKINVSFPCLKF